MGWVVWRDLWRTHIWEELPQIDKRAPAVLSDNEDNNGTIDSELFHENDNDSIDRELFPEDDNDYKKQLL